jgi:cytochrome c oxidase assembly protein subunit 15
MKKLAIIALLLVIALVSVSAYLRLNNSGIGCADWPNCYGMIGSSNDAVPTIASAYEQMLMDAQQPLSWATPVHRFIASILGLTILAMALISLRLRRERMITLSLLALTVFLAWLGIYSSGLLSPAIVMGNLGGGFAMLSLLGWMVFRDAQPSSCMRGNIRNWVIAALLLLFIQIALGGLTSANFAASACQTLPDCQGSYLPGPDLLSAFDLARSHETSPAGFVLGGPERADIHKLHRIVALVTAATIILVSLLGQRARLGWNATVILLLVVAEFSVGVAAIVTKLPITIAVAHNWLAAMLVIALLRLLALCNKRKVLA